jgi:N-acetyllactosaminide beta-1,3-N-acetylglucosaminyltransferase
MNFLDTDPGKEKPHKNPRIYVLPIFEVEEGYAIPDTKEDLKKLLKSNLAVPFHKYVCPECHKVPKYNSWLKAKYIPNQINIFHTAKRKRPYQFWEPIYIGTNQDPLYDERLSWEGLRDKMSQGFVLCILDYDFMIMDNAFLVHRPGIKKKKRNKKPTLAIRRQNRLLTSKIQREITQTYGKRPGCYI